MLGKNLLESYGPVTQSLAAIKALLAWRGRAVDPLPSFVEMGKGDNRMVLVLSNKKDCYYVVTARVCSCPGNQFRHNCKHIRKYFPQEQTAPTKPAATDSLIKRGGFKPVSPLPGEEKAVDVSSPIYTDMHDTTNKDVAYWNIKEDREFWPLCEA